MTTAGVEDPFTEGVLGWNLCEVPPWVIASEAFNRRPRPLELPGVRKADRRLFEKLDTLPDPAERGRVFHEYLEVKFSLHQWAEYQGLSRRSLRNSYVRFLNGWARDSNGVEGAVLKSWVQSRFGVVPTYHGGVLDPTLNGEDQQFAIDRMKGRRRTNAIDMQLDLLYTFCQDELTRRWPDRETLILYRGTNDPEEHPCRRVIDRQRSCLRLNNLISFTTNRETAWEFGSTVWETRVAHSKIIFFSGLLPSSILQGESEYLVVGGDYTVRELLY